jgi:hypothetical protein
MARQFMIPTAASPRYFGATQHEQRPDVYLG